MDRPGRDRRQRPGLRCDHVVLDFEHQLALEHVEDVDDLAVAVGRRAGKARRRRVVDQGERAARGGGVGQDRDRAAADRQALGLVRSGDAHRDIRRDVRIRRLRVVAVEQGGERLEARIVHAPELPELGNETVHPARRVEGDNPGLLGAGVPERVGGRGQSEHERPGRRKKRLVAGAELERTVGDEPRLDVLVVPVQPRREPTACGERRLEHTEALVGLVARDLDRGEVPHDRLGLARLTDDRLHRRRL